MPWFKRGATTREKWLGFWLLVWDALSLMDSIILTFRCVDTPLPQTGGSDSLRHGTRQKTGKVGAGLMGLDRDGRQDDRCDK